MRRWLAVGSAVLLAACLAAPLRAQPKEDQDDLKITVEALKQRVKEQDRRMKEQETRLAELSAASQPATASAKAIQREAIKEVLAEMQKDVATRAANLPDWAQNLKFGGDFRLRYEYNGFNWGATANTEKKDRNRARFRLRFGATKTWLDDQLEVGFRLASGENNDATSTNQSLGVVGDFDKKNVWIDLAYAKYTPKDVKGFSIIGGKIAKPWIENDVFFDTDVNPEGFWAQYTAPKMGPIELFVGAGYFIVKESAADADSDLALYQAGVRAEITKDVKYTFAANYQDWDRYDVSGATARGNDSPLSRVPGFRVINLTNNLDIASVFGRPLNMFADFAHNCGEADEASSKYDGQDNAFAAGVRYGQNKKKGDWSLKYRYGHVQANALPGHFVDSDFGFANRKGHVLGAEYNILDSLSVGVNVFLTQPIFSPTTTGGSSAFEDMTTTVLADLVWKF
jgi:hypothetical protein